MAEIQTTTDSNLPGNKWRKSLKIDMTPMVDLGFLLITFFIFTTSMTEAAKLNLFMPADGAVSNIGDSSVISIILADDDKIFYYEGEWLQAVNQNKVLTTGYSTTNGVGKLVRAKQRRMGVKRHELMLLIKPTEGASYKNVINALDEILINDMTKYAIVDLNTEEKAYMHRQ